MAVALKKIWAFHDGPFAGYFVGRDPGVGVNVAWFIREDVAKQRITAERERCARMVEQAGHPALADEIRLAEEI